MKHYFFILICLMSFSQYVPAQLKVIEPTGNDGIGIKLPNANNYNWYMTSENTNYWSHTNTLTFMDNTEFLLFQLWPNQSVYINGLLNLDFWVQLDVNDKGRLAQSNGYDFNPNSTTQGLLVTQCKSESSGLYCDGDLFAIFSPGDSYLLKVLDEDGMVLKWYLDGNGNAFTSSDEKRKENITSLTNCIESLKKLDGKRYTFIKETDVQTTTGEYADFPGSKIEIDNNKYDPSKYYNFGFLAQDVEKVFPELVGTDETGNKYVSYTQFVPVLVEALKEQQLIIDKKQKEVDDLKVRINKLERQVQEILSMLKPR
jgi:hypothetical protein